MALNMIRTRDSVRFEWSDGEVDSAVTVLPEDDEQTMVRKLKRIIALVEGEQAPPTPFRAMAQAAGIPPAALAPTRPTNGWAAPEVPEHLLGDVELIMPGEDA